MLRGSASRENNPNISPGCPHLPPANGRGIALARTGPRIDPPAYGLPLPSYVGWVVPFARGKWGQGCISIVPNAENNEFS